MRAQLHTAAAPKKVEAPAVSFAKAKAKSKPTPTPREAPLPKSGPLVAKGVGGGNVLSLRLPAGLPGVSQAQLVDFVKSCETKQWFTGKGRDIAKVDVAERARVDVGAKHFELAVLDVNYKDGGKDTFHTPLIVAADGTLSDALADADFIRALVSGVRESKSLKSSSGLLRLEKTAGTQIADASGAAVKAIGGPQSNVSIKVGDDVMFKAYRKPEAGTPIEREVTAHLTAQRYANTPQLLGTLTLDTKSGPMTVGMLFELVKSDGDGWGTTLQGLKDGADLSGELTLLGTRIGEMHKALGARVSDPAFAPRDITREDLQEWSSSIARELDDTIAKATAADPALGAKLLDAKPKLLAKLAALGEIEPSGLKTRIHGDLHLGQVLRKNGDWKVLDFEGEPARSKEERRGFYTPLRDVAGMLRSFAYAEAEAVKDGADVVTGWAKDVGGKFVDAYKAAVDGLGLLPKTDDAFTALLEAVELEKALYEVRYELKSRPAMVHIPATRVLEMAS